MMRDCLRCGQRFTVHAVADIHCPLCIRELQTLLAADARRRVVRFRVGKALDRSPA
jgi:predicted DCC family thiol-disulfide oxidoreductase YuxK